MTSTSDEKGTAANKRPTTVDVDPIGTDGRHVRRVRRLGPDATCGLCGQSQVECLTTKPRSILEVHHVAGRRNDADLVVVLCLNCHARAGENQRSAGVLTSSAPASSVEAMEAGLRSLASFFALIVETCLRWADQLASLVNALDDHFPAWRSLPGLT